MMNEKPRGRASPVWNRARLAFQGFIAILRGRTVIYNATIPLSRAFRITEPGSLLADVRFDCPEGLKPVVIVGPEGWGGSDG